MVNAPGPAVQAYAVQPSFVAGNEARANTEKVQPRAAPAASSQRADQRTLESRDEQKTQDARQDARREEARAADERRGSRVDVTV